MPVRKPAQARRPEVPVLQEAAFGVNQEALAFATSQHHHIALVGTSIALRDTEPHAAIQFGELSFGSQLQLLQFGLSCTLHLGQTLQLRLARTLEGNGRGRCSGGRSHSSRRTSKRNTDAARRCCRCAGRSMSREGRGRVESREGLRDQGGCRTAQPAHNVKQAVQLALEPGNRPSASVSHAEWSRASVLGDLSVLALDHFLVAVSCLVAVSLGLFSRPRRRQLELPLSLGVPLLQRLHFAQKRVELSVALSTSCMHATARYETQSRFLKDGSYRLALCRVEFILQRHGSLAQLLVLHVSPFEPALKTLQPLLS